MNHHWALLELLARDHQEELRREAEAARRAALLDNRARDVLRLRLGRALIRLGGLRSGGEAARRAERA
ncbi:MAG TPA: hypothetical protein VFM39_07595 [bacterium]|nr:hypothetical protein [bacterium]